MYRRRRGCFRCHLLDADCALSWLGEGSEKNRFFCPGIRCYLFVFYLRCLSKGNSSWDYTLPTNLSVVFANASPQARLFLIRVAGEREVVHFSAVQLRRAFSILGTDEFPLPENLTLSLEQVSGLRRLLASISQSIILGTILITINLIKQTIQFF